ncbi:FkbM family methyltransferase [Halorubrum sp. SD690R]|uniref:FkbM family methyltransferase n=1 Tax=Halorubrum sp. SD690R TaxID=2518117 RepID=UPI0013051300|nr:FkbM family methyltransferase [Halorubrum sp. SD690R]
MLDEHCLAYPSNNVWNIVSVPRLKLKRKLPTLSTLVYGTRHGSKKHIDLMEELYTFEDFVEVEKGDLVVDVGAYVGGFTLFASKRARNVIAVEPNEAISSVLSENVSSSENVVAVPKAAWGREETVRINQSSFLNENSILDPDSGDIGDYFEVQADTIPNIVRSLDFSKIDYLKIEAEGVEPEILNGALDGNMDIEKIAVDASAERDGQSTVTEIKEILEENGYQGRTKDNNKLWSDQIVFGKKRVRNRSE